jgi:hypothetical protein
MMRLAILLVLALEFSPSPVQAQILVIYENQTVLATAEINPGGGVSSGPGDQYYDGINGVSTSTYQTASDSTGAAASATTQYTSQFSVSSTNLTFSMNETATVSTAYVPGERTPTNGGADDDIQFILSTPAILTANITSDWNGSQAGLVVENSSNGRWVLDMSPGQTESLILDPGTYLFDEDVQIDIDPTTSESLTQNGSVSFDVTAIPEPSTSAGILIGLVVMGFGVRSARLGRKKAAT